MTTKKTADETVKNKNFVVPKEQADLEFENWAERIDLDTDVDDMDDDDQKAFKKWKKIITRALCRGNLTFNEDGEPVYTCVEEKSKTLFGKELVFHTRTGVDAMTGMDGNKKNQNMKSMYKTVASMTGINPLLINNLAGRDIKMCETIFVLLMS